MPTSPETLCFTVAFIKTAPTHPSVNSPRISQEEWLRHLVAHMRGVRHREDEIVQHLLRAIDPVGNAIKEIVLKDDYEQLTEEEAIVYEELLIATLHGDIDTVKDMIDKVQALRDPFLSPLQPVATIAARNGHIEVLKFALTKGALLNHDLCLAIRRGQDSKEEMQQLFLHNLKAITKELNKPPTYVRRWPNGEPVFKFNPGNRFDDINW